MIRQLAKRAFRTIGIHAFRTRSMPRGIALDVDLRRIFQARSPDVIFDVGANIGQTSEFFASIFPGATIFAFEPISSTYDALRKNTKGIARIRTERLSLGDREGDAVMKLGAESGWSRVIEGNQEASHSPETSETVRMMRIDTYCAEKGIRAIDVLKTDCEGFDLKVLQGAGAMLKLQAIGAVYSEVNFRRDGSHADFFAVESYMSSLGYSFYALYDYSGWQYDVSRFGFANALFLSEPLVTRVSG